MILPKNKIAVFYLLLNISVAWSQSKLECNDKIKTGFINPPVGSAVWKNKINDTLKKEVTLIFESGFKDTLEIYHNKKVIKTDLYETDFSTSYTGKTLSIVYSKSKCKKNILMVRSLTNKSCVVFEIKKGFRLIEISRVNGVWWINYSNYPPQFE